MMIDSVINFVNAINVNDGLNSRKGLKFVVIGDLYKICDVAHDTY